MNQVNLQTLLASVRKREKPRISLSEQCTTDTLQKLQMKVKDEVPEPQVCYLCGEQGGTTTISLEIAFLKSYLFPSSHGFEEKQLYCAFCSKAMQQLKDIHNTFVSNKEELEDITSCVKTLLRVRNEIRQEEILPSETELDAKVSEQEHAQFGEDHLEVTEFKLDLQTDLSDTTEGQHDRHSIYSNHLDETQESYQSDYNNEKEKACTDGRFACSYKNCGSSFACKQGLSRHVKEVHRKEDRLICYFCGTTRARTSGLFHHITIAHLDEFPIKCVIKNCKFRARYNMGLLIHTKKAHAEEWRKLQELGIYSKFEIECPHCKKTFLTKKGLQQHLPTHLNPSKRTTYSCDVCGKSYLKENGLKEHLSSKHGHTGKLLRCPVEGCKSLPFPSKARLTLHIKYVHTYNHKTCEVCGFLCRNEMSYRQHKTGSKPCARIAGKDLRSFKCTYPSCSKSLLSQKSLDRHVSVMHEFQLPYKCGECKSSFRYRKELLSHCKQRHGGVSCDICTKRFTSAYTLSQHKNEQHVIHKDMFTCDFTGCDNAYTTSNQLRRHVLKVHDINLQEENHDKKGYKCGVEGCQNAYLFRSQLQCHIREAHSSISFDCYFCGNKLKSKVNRDEHMMTKHLQELPWACTFKGCTFRNGSKGYLQKHIKLLKHFTQEQKIAKNPTSENKVKHIKLEGRCGYEGCGRPFCERLRHQQNRKEKNLCKCYFCGEEFVSRNSMEIHVMGQHLNERPYICGVEGCGLITASKYHMNTHMKTKHV